LRSAVALIVALTALTGGTAAQAAPPKVRQMVVYRDGSAQTETVSTRASVVRVGGRRCTTGARTPLAALVRARPGTLRLRDFGSCSLRAGDGGGLFVKAIGRDANRGQNGWVYKVGRRAATAGAADPRGPFGRGRLRRGQRLTWFYCRLRNGGCQPTLELKLRPEPGGVVVSVRGYDDEGHGLTVQGATVSAGGVSALTDADGQASLALAPGRHLAIATKEGTIRSFAEPVELP
jgi:hypothetical protein